MVLSPFNYDFVVGFVFSEDGLIVAAVVDLHADQIAEAVVVAEDAVLFDVVAAVGVLSHAVAEAVVILAVAVAVFVVGGAVLVEGGGAELVGAVGGLAGGGVVAHESAVGVLGYGAAVAQVKGTGAVKVDGDKSVGAHEIGEGRRAEGADEAEGEDDGENHFHCGFHGFVLLSVIENVVRFIGSVGFHVRVLLLIFLSLAYGYSVTRRLSQKRHTQKKNAAGGKSGWQLRLSAVFLLEK